MKNDMLDKGSLEDILHGFDQGDIWVEDGDKKNWHILHAAAYFERLDVLEALYERMGEEEFFNLRGIVQLILPGNELHNNAFLNWSIMHVAMNAQPKIFEWLMSHGGNKPEYLLARDNDGHTPLHALIISYAHNPIIHEKETERVSKLVDLLSTYGSLDLLNATQKTGRTALSFLSHRIYIDDTLYVDRLNMLMHLVKQGATIDETDFSNILLAWADTPNRISCHQPNFNLNKVRDWVAENCLFPLIQLPAFKTFHQILDSKGLGHFLFRYYAFGPTFPEARNASPFLIDAGAVFYIPSSPKIDFTSLYAHPRLNEIFLKTFYLDFAHHILSDPTSENIILIYAKAFLMEVQKLRIGSPQQQASIQKAMDLLNDPITRNDPALVTSSIASLRDKIAVVQKAKPYFVISFSFSSILAQPFSNFEKLDLALSHSTNHQNHINTQVKHVSI